ncbi:MAG: hypothetical protein ACR2QR_11370, partial [Woeseiaceae bacterium]
MLNRILTVLFLPAFLAGCNESPIDTGTAESGVATIFCGVLIDGLGNAPMRDQTLTIVDERISAITSGAPT